MGGKVESSLVSDKGKAEELIKELLLYIQKAKLKALRVGVSGPPGAGKSSLIETLGLHLLSQNHFVYFSLLLPPPSPLLPPLFLFLY